MSDKDVIADALDEFTDCSEAENENREAARDDVRFGRLDEQWSAEDEKARKDDGRPALTSNRLGPMMRSVYNDARLNRPGIVCYPVDDAGDPETAEILNGLIRNIEQSSDADVAYDTALEHAVDRGFGYFKINTRYTRDDAFDQELVIERVANPFSIYGDPTSTAADSSDWDIAFELDVMNKRQFKARFKDAEFTSFTEAAEVKSPQATGDKVTIASRWIRETVYREIVALSDGQVVSLEAYEKQKALFDALGATIVGQPRQVPSYKVTQYLLSGSEVLEKVDWAGKYIPIIPVYGEEVNEDGKRHLRSLIRGAKDDQKRYNIHISAATERTANDTKAPWVGAVGQFKTDARRWATSNENHPYLEYDPVTAANGQIMPPPQRLYPGGVDAAAVQAAMLAADDIKSTIGLYDAALGARSNETSGVAIEARKVEGDVSTFHFVDNLSRAIRHGGRVLIDLIPKVYSVPRVLRVLGPDGEPSLAKVNQEVQVEQKGPDGEVQKISRIYDLTTGRYDVTVKAGPSFSSRRKEAVAQMIELLRAYPAAAPLIGDLLAKNLDWPGADEVAKRLYAMLPAELRGEDAASQEAKAAMAKMAEAMQQLQAQLAEAENDAAYKARDLEIKAYEAQTDRMKVEQDAELKRLQALVGQLSGGLVRAA